MNCFEILHSTSFSSNVLGKTITLKGQIFDESYIKRGTGQGWMHKFREPFLFGFYSLLIFLLVVLAIITLDSATSRSITKK